jgi:hypothetical protein
MEAYVGRSLVVINSQALQIPTISKLRVLYDNYIRDAGVNEHVTPTEQVEENNLLDSFMATPVMKYTMHFLADKGTVKSMYLGPNTALKHYFRAPFGIDSHVVFFMHI